MIRGARAAKSAPSWQDIRAVYPPTAVCGAFRMHGAHVLPKPAHFGCMACESCHELAIFPSEAAFGMHGAQTCHGLPPGNAPRRNLATARPPGTHRARILPLPVRPRAHQGAIPPPSDAGGTHFAGILPSASARERIRAQSCHRQAPGNTSMKNLHNRHLTIVYKTLTRNQAEYNKEIGF